MYGIGLAGIPGGQYHPPPMGGRAATRFLFRRGRRQGVQFMQVRFSTKVLALVLVVTVALFATSCGTILYPERRGQPRGVIDPGVLLLDAVGLIFFVVPGIVAFCVDFSTGAIYYPPASFGPPGCGPVSQNPIQRADLVQDHVPKDELTQAKIEEVVSRRAGRPVTLKPGQYRAAEISDLDEFGEQAERLSAPNADAPPAAVRMR